MKKTKELELNYMNIPRKEDTLILSKQSSEKVTSNIDKNHISDSKEKYRCNSCEHKNKLKIILKDTIEIYQNNSKLEKESSVWSKFRNKVSNIKNNIKYNTLTTNSLLNFYDFIIIRIFDKIYFTKEDLEKFLRDSYYLIYMSYRNEFPAIENKKKNKHFTTDCGWGCMLRCGQMILSRAIQMIKLSQPFYNNKNNPFTENSKLNCIIETILLFIDSPLNYEEIKHNQSFVDLLSNILKQMDKNLLSDDQESNVNKGKHYNVSLIKAVMPPFSIHNICKVGELMDKSAGEWFSDINIIHILKQLNDEVKPIENMEIFVFPDGVIYHKQIIELCFQPLNKEHSDTFIDNETIIFDDKKYLFKKSGIIFVSQRLGLDKISSNYFNSIKSIFEIPLNLGLIGGKSNTAYYFIGTADDYLIYLDPHFNQKSVSSYEELQKNCTSYLKKQIYQLPIKSISPSFTVGFYFRNLREYNELTSKISYYVKHQEYPCFGFLDEKKEFIDLDVNRDVDDF